MLMNKTMEKFMTYLCNGILQHNKKNKHVITWMNLKHMLGEKVRLQKSKYSLIPFMESICSLRSLKLIHCIRVRTEVTSGGSEKVLTRRGNKECPGKLEFFYTFI